MRGAAEIVNQTTSYSAVAATSFTVPSDYISATETVDVCASCSTSYSFTPQAPTQQADNVETYDVSNIGTETGTDGEIMSDDNNDSSDDVFADETKLNAELVKWYIEFGVSLDALGALLKLLHGFHPHLPVDARTLLKTPNTCNVNISPIGEGQYCHFGVASGIQNMYQQGFFDSAQVSNKFHCRLILMACHCLRAQTINFGQF